MNYAIIFGLVMGMFHYLSEEFCPRCGKHKNPILSFSAGISVTYIFLYLFPEFISHASGNKYLFMPILFGFALFHIIEKYIYLKTPEEKWRREIALEDSIVSFIYHFIVGIMITFFVSQSISRGTLFFIPVFIYTAISSLPVDSPRSKKAAAVLAASTPLGSLFASYLYPGIPQMIITVMLGFLIGVLSFTVFRHSIPKRNNGSPLFFILGILAYLSLMFLL